MDNQKLPKATHEGDLILGDKTLSSAVLDDGTRILTATAVFKAFDRIRKGKSSETYRADQMPSFINANNLQPFVNEQLLGWTKLIEYTSLNGSVKTGYNARLIRGLCKVYMDARANGVLHPSQQKQALAAESLLYALSDLGITALVDEATGFQKDRKNDALQAVLKSYIAEELLKWQKKFPDAYYTEIFRLKKWGKFSLTGEKPKIIGKWTNALIYKQLPEGVLEKLKSKTPKSSEGNYTAKFHQSLTPDIGHPALTAQIYKVIGLMNISNDWNEFQSHFNKMIDRKNGQMEIDFDAVEKETEKPENTKQLSDFNKNLQMALNFNPKEDDESDKKKDDK